MPDMNAKEKRLAANQERVRRYRAKVTPPSAQPRPAPLTGAERAQRCRERKRQANIQNVLAPQNHDVLPIQAKQYPSQQHTRLYRLRLEVRAQSRLPVKRILFTNKELCQRYHAKKQQPQLKAYLERNSTELEESEIAEPIAVSLDL